MRLSSLFVLTLLVGCGRSSEEKKAAVYQTELATLKRYEADLAQGQAQYRNAILPKILDDREGNRTALQWEGENGIITQLQKRAEAQKEIVEQMEEEMHPGKKAVRARRSGANGKL